jgi:hydrogenase expression/formation protein HypE
MHDPTRGGLATTCHEVASRAGVRIVLDEEALPIRSETATTCELLGLDPLYLACEGRILFLVAPEQTAPLLRALRAHPLGRDAAQIGHVTEGGSAQAPVTLRTSIGGERPVDLLSGAELPRIC